MFFLGICFIALAPLTHLALQHGAAKMLHFAGTHVSLREICPRTHLSAFIAPVLTSCAAYVFGLVFYATHFPECKWPGRFDYIGHSHQVRGLIAVCVYGDADIASVAPDMALVHRSCHLPARQGMYPHL